MAVNRFLLVKANAKFPEGTAAGLYKAAVASQPNYDILRVDSQRINWTLKELDVSNDHESIWRKRASIVRDLD